MALNAVHAHISVCVHARVRVSHGVNYVQLHEFWIMFDSLTPDYALFMLWRQIKCIVFVVKLPINVHVLRVKMGIAVSMCI